jgi:hypothetical protein
MPSLSFEEGKEGRPIALVKGGADDGELLYLHDDSLSTAKRPKFVVDKMKYMGDLKDLKPGDRTKAFALIEEALKGDESVIKTAPPVVRTLWMRVQKDKDKTNEVVLDDGGLFSLIPNPDPTKREVWYVTGTSGSGKSWIAREYAEHYHKLFPKRDIYLISKLDEDETLDKLKYLKRVPIKSLIEDYPKLEEMRESLMIMDDYDTLTNDAEKVVLKLIDDVAIMGRHTLTSMMCLSHFSTNYKKTRLILSEATHIVVYPNSTSYHALRHLLHNYAGVDEDLLKVHRKLGSRWLCYSKQFPTYMISQRSAALLNS